MANDRLEWVARIIGAIFVDPKSWIRDLDFGRDGLHLNKTGARELGELYSRVFLISCLFPVNFTKINKTALPLSSLPFHTFPHTHYATLNVQSTAVCSAEG